MTRILAALAAAFFMASCSSTVSIAVADKAAEIQDQALANAEYAICNAFSVGAIRRRYGKSNELAAAYNNLCAENRGQIVQGLAE